MRAPSKRATFHIFVLVKFSEAAVDKLVVGNIAYFYIISKYLHLFIILVTYEHIQFVLNTKSVIICFV